METPSANRAATAARIGSEEQVCSARRVQVLDGRARGARLEYRTLAPGASVAPRLSIRVEDLAP